MFAYMPKRSSRRRQDEDANEIAARVVGHIAVESEAAEELPAAADGKNPAAVALGRLGGKKGGPARAAKLSPERRSEIARKAAQVRWSREHEEEESS